MKITINVEKEYANYTYVSLLADGQLICGLMMIRTVDLDRFVRRIKPEKLLANRAQITDRLWTKLHLKKNFSLQ